jgi:hypothetical protein
VNWRKFRGVVYWIKRWKDRHICLHHEFDLFILRTSIGPHILLFSDSFRIINERALLIAELWLFWDATYFLIWPISDRKSHKSIAGAVLSNPPNVTAELFLPTARPS